MTRTMRLVLLSIAILALAACAGNRQLYSWENYSNTLYDYKKNPSPETYAAHKEELLKIIRVSEEEGRRVPPGVFGELCFLLALEKKVPEALPYCSREKATYPESAYFMEKLTASIEKNK